MRPPETEEGLKIARWQLTEWFEWRTHSDLWTSQSHFDSSLPFLGEDDYLRRLLDIDPSTEFDSSLPIVDYRELKEKEALRRWLLVGYVTLIWSITFLAVTLALSLLHSV